MLRSEGVKLDRHAHDFVAPTETLRPLRDQIVVRPLPWNPSRTIQIAGDANRTRRRGTVVATGPGCYPWRYNADRSKRWLSKAFRKTEVKVGDIVELAGPDKDSDWMFPTVMIGNELHVVCREEDVCGIVDG